MNEVEKLVKQKVEELESLEPDFTGETGAFVLSNHTYGNLVSDTSWWTDDQMSKLKEQTSSEGDKNMSKFSEQEIPREVLDRANVAWAAANGGDDSREAVFRAGMEHAEKLLKDHKAASAGPLMWDGKKWKPICDVSERIEKLEHKTRFMSDA